MLAAILISKAKMLEPMLEPPSCWLVLLLAAASLLRLCCVSAASPLRLRCISAASHGENLLPRSLCFQVLRVPHALSRKACASLRRAVDQQGKVSVDSVDDLPNVDIAVRVQCDSEAVPWRQRFLYSAAVTNPTAAATHALLATPTSPYPPHHAHLTIPSSPRPPRAPCQVPAELLESLIGKEEASALLSLPHRYLYETAGSDVRGDVGGTAPGGAAGTGTGGGRTPRMALAGSFARRYVADRSGQEQPLTSFHFDSAAVTVNVALTDDNAFSGGKLLGVFGGAVQAITRAEGEASVHSSSLLHGVSRMREGVRYSLILFFGYAGGAAA